MNVRGLQYINADEIARELNPHDVDSVRIKAARLFFAQIDKCIDEGVSFIIEMTLAGKNSLKFDRLKSLGYRVHVIYIFVDASDVSIERIVRRVQNGGHHVPDEDVVRRFHRSRQNFWHIYRQLAFSWEVVYNGGKDFIEVAKGQQDDYDIKNEQLFVLFEEGI
ncbi:Zeta toxin [Candidatus Magnetobacterium bavaricum]|uniref:Zeta toxin n=1 Tax=Candidatus Magnetobacterium bavaricum TaxID=29290 RepID=A0A0F3GTJ7_9BACT|nr:Zeta toxin [Candidatus Magnetobacterium bavaricum]